ncbi:MAG: hypothetical protein A3H35_03920 [Betaproteobacteria bacterium RIFCSPLOWO2_02_FULL_62_17]|nr:MAG: hypothetical protein A3H35_03920 [Betaproteobacteria bacterium RIFCSPLOWO2_02_FULL_62_17]
MAGVYMKRLLKTILLIGVFAAVSAAQAQVYQWKDPETKTTRLSNSAPPWYRNMQRESRAPRVQVFYYGVLADDTSLAFEVRQAMRSQSPIGRSLPPLVSPASRQARR